MSRHLHHAPADCPVCGHDLIITRKGCPSCGTELAGEFADCQFCALEKTDLELLNVFLASRGNLRDVEKFLGVSYPTARGRLDAVLAKLDLTVGGGAQQDAPEQPRHRPQRAVEDEPEEQVHGTADTSSGDGSHEEDGPTPRQQVLARVASGEISAEVAQQLIAALEN